MMLKKHCDKCDRVIRDDDECAAAVDINCGEETYELCAGCHQDFVRSFLGRAE